MGTVGTTLLIKGRKVRLREAYDDSDMKSYKAALDKVMSEAKRMREAASAEAKSGGQGFRKQKAAK